MPEDQTSADGAARRPYQVQGFNARLFSGNSLPPGRGNHLWTRLTSHLTVTPILRDQQFSFSWGEKADARPTFG